MLSPNNYKAFLKVCDDISNLGAQLHGKVSALSIFRELAMHDHIYKPEHFKVQEFVPKVLYDGLGDKALWAMDSRIVWTADAIRDYFNLPVIINNWHTGGQFSNRGFRMPDCNDGAKILSQHKCGRAIDFDVKGITAEEVRQEIIKHHDDPAFQFITTLEANVNWVHIDNRNTMQTELFIIHPTSA